MKRREFCKFILLAIVAAVAEPPTAHAQQKAMPVIGYLGNNSPDGFSPSLAGFRQGLGEVGYVEGQNLTIEYRWAEGHYDRLPAFAADLVGRKVDLIVASGTPGIQAAKGATSTIPIVFFGGGNLVAAGLIASLARPGGNLTGFSIFSPELNLMRFGLLADLVPQARVIALLVNPNRSDTESVIGDVQKAAGVKGVQIHILKAGTEAEIDAAFTSLVQLRAGALVAVSDPFFYSRREQLLTLSSRYTVPAIWEWREFARAGGLISYGPSLTDGWRSVGLYAGEILKGAKLAELPVQQPTKFELVINLKTAQALGITLIR